MSRESKENKTGQSVNVPTITQVMEELNDRGVFRGLSRYQYLPYDIEQALKVVEAIGKRRNPKFRIDAENRFAYENFLRWCYGDRATQALDPQTRHPVPGDLKKGIYIAGGTGTGKSWCMEIMHAYCLVMGFQIEFSSESIGLRSLTWITARADRICDEYSRQGTLSEYQDKPLLCIQDFGSEPTESLYMGNRVNVIRQLLEYRGDMEEQLTLITSNLSLGNPTIKDRYGDRVASRLWEMCNYLEIKGPDRRKQPILP